MTSTPLDARSLAADVLRTGGSVKLATLIQGLLELDEQRDLARQLGLAPKGGFRVERAPVRILAPALAEVTEPEAIDAVCERLAQKLLRPPETAIESTEKAAGAASLEPMLKLKEQELERLRDKLDKAREVSARHREREEELVRELGVEQAGSARLRAEIRDLRRQLAGRRLEPTTTSPEGQRVHELVREREMLTETEERLRRREAAQAAEIRRLEHENEDLRSRLPKGRRRREPPPPPPPPPEQFRLPHFADAFYKSLEGKERRAVERAIRAVLLFCVEGPSYPGLEVKQLEGTHLWSLRASLKLRVYFTMRDDGDVDILGMADREDQHTTLRRFKER